MYIRRIARSSWRSDENGIIKSYTRDKIGKDQSKSNNVLMKRGEKKKIRKGRSRNVLGN